MDVAHCRINLLCEGLNTADVFTQLWEQHTGRTFHRWADIATIIGLLDAGRRHPSARRKRFDIEAMLQRAVDELDGQYTAQNARHQPIQKVRDHCVTTRGTGVLLVDGLSPRWRKCHDHDLGHRSFSALKWPAAGSHRWPPMGGIHWPPKPDGNLRYLA